MTGDEMTDLSALDQQHGRLLRLAESLLRDPHDAADAVAHAVQQATAGRRRDGVPIAAFLRTAIRRFASNLRRAGRTRHRHERAAARGEAVPGTDELVAREQLRRRVADAVIALPEPYRATVWLCHLEELSTTDVGQRLGVAEATVRVRLHRARQVLRERLDRDYGDRAKWAAVATPLLPVASVGLFASLGGLTVKQAFIGAAIALLAISGALAWQSGPPTAAVAPHAVIAAASSLPPGEPLSTPSERRDVAASPTAPGSANVAMRILYDDGRPAADLPYWTWPDGLPSLARPTTLSGRTPVTTLPTPSGATGSDGSLNLDVASPVTVQLVDGIFATWLEPEGTHRLPPMTTLAVALLGAPPNPVWEVIVHPIHPIPEGGWATFGEEVRAVRTGDAEVLVAMRDQRHWVDGASTTTVPAFAGFSCSAEGDSLGLQIPGTRPVMAPGSLELHCTGSYPILHVRYLETDGITVIVEPLAVMMETEPSSMVERSTTGDVRCNIVGDTTRMTIIAVTRNESFTAKLAPAPQGETRFDFVRGRGTPLWHLGARGNVDVREFWWRRQGGAWQAGTPYLTSRGPSIVHWRDHPDVHGLDPSNAEVLVTTSGGVLTGRDGGPGRWLSTRTLPANDSAALSQLRGRVEWSVQILLPEASETWATIANGIWLADSQSIPFTTEAPEGFDVRLVLRADTGDVIVPWPR
jgi:RNA polymerase sigma-70 factor (ECF subfamily)